MITHIQTKKKEVHLLATRKINISNYYAAVISISSLCLVRSLLLKQGWFWLHVKDNWNILNLTWGTKIILLDFESDFQPRRLCFRWTQLLCISLTSETWNELFPVSKIIVTLLRAVFNPVHGELNFLCLNYSCIFHSSSALHCWQTSHSGKFVLRLCPIAWKTEANDTEFPVRFFNVH